MIKTARKTRKKLIVAMDTVINQLNDELLIDEWLAYGVADGDITEVVLRHPQLLDDIYTDEEAYNEVCQLFTRLMIMAGETERPFI